MSYKGEGTIKIQEKQWEKFYEEIDKYSSSTTSGLGIKEIFF